MGLKNNEFVELRSGDRITLRNGDVLSYDEYYDRITNRDDSRLNYNEDLTHKEREELDIIEIKRAVDYKTIFTEDDRTESKAITDAETTNELDELRCSVKCIAEFLDNIVKKCK